MLKQQKVDTDIIPWTVSGHEHPSASMPAVCCATKHIVHKLDSCVGVYILFGLDMAAAAQVLPI